LIDFTASIVQKSGGVFFFGRFAHVEGLIGGTAANKPGLGSSWESLVIRMDGTMGWVLEN